MRRVSAAKVTTAKKPKVAKAKAKKHEGRIKRGYFENSNQRKTACVS